MHFAGAVNEKSKFSKIDSMALYLRLICQSNNCIMNFCKMSAAVILLLPLTVNAQDRVYNTGQAFTCISVDSNYNIWAGTNKAGLYFLNKSVPPGPAQFQQLPAAGSINFNNFVFNSIAVDKTPYIWAGHSGSGGGFAGGGGIERVNINNTGDVKHYSPDRNAECFNFFQRDGLATLHCASLSLDSNGNLWSAHRYHDLTSSPDYILTPGSLSYKFAGSDLFFSKGTYQSYTSNTEPAELPYPAYTCNPTPTQTPQARSCDAVAAGKNEVWVAVRGYTVKRTQQFLPNRLLRYNLNGTFIAPAFTFQSVGIPAGGVFNGLHVASNGDVWVSASAGKGFAVRRKKNWIYMDPQKIPCIFPAGATIGSNAIWGNKLGQVFIGTSKGLIVYNGVGPVQSVSSYTLYTTSNSSLPTNQVNGGASEKDSVQWVATAGGILRSTFGRNYPAAADSADYTSCNNAVINAIEAQADQDLSARRDYHSYQVETVICTQTGINGNNCNAQYVYKRMKDSVRYTTPTVADFPYDNLKAALLRNITDAELLTVVANVNGWQLNMATGNPNGGIRQIQQVLTAALKANYYDCLTCVQDGQLPFLFGEREYSPAYREQYAASVANVNPVRAISCNQVYKLYNAPNFFPDRILYRDIIRPLFGCDALTSSQYDEVKVFADDRNMSITNYTDPGHFLYPGKVFRQVVEECGQVKIITIGSGLSSCGSNSAGRNNAVGNIIVGSILFKNIDLRLKQSFERTP